MATVTIKISDAEDDDGGETIKLSIKSDPPFNVKDESANTPAQSIAGQLFSALASDLGSPLGQ